MAQSHLNMLKSYHECDESPAAAKETQRVSVVVAVEQSSSEIACEDDR